MTFKGRNFLQLPIILVLALIIISIPSVSLAGNQTITFSQAVSMSMKSLNKAGKNLTDKQIIDLANKKGLLPKKNPTYSSKVSKKLLTSIFLSTAGMKIFDESLNSKETSAVNEMIKNVNQLSEITPNTSDSTNNALASIDDFNQLLNEYNYKNFGWKCMKPAWSYYSNRKLTEAIKIFQICSNATNSGLLKTTDLANAYYGYASLSGDNDIKNFDAAYTYAEKAIKTEPNSSPAKQAKKLIDKMKSNGISRELGFDYKSNQPITYEALMASLAYNSYFKYKSVPAGFSLKDKKGNLPSEWARKFVYYFASSKNGSLMPSIPESFTAPVPRYWAASLFARCAFYSNYDYNDYQKFNDLGKLTANDRMFINIALDRKLFPQVKSESFNPFGTFKHSELKDLVLNFYSNFKNKKQASNKSYNKTNYKKIVAAYGCDDGVANFVNQASLVPKNKDRVNILSMIALYDTSNDANTNLFSNPNYKNEGTKFIKSKFVVSPELNNFLNTAKENGIKCFADLAGREQQAYDMFKESSKRKDVVADLVKIAELYDLGGIEVTLEYLPGEARANFSDFVKALSKALHDKNKLLYVTVGAYSSDELESKSAFDYGLIGQYADYIGIILYDDFPMSKYLVGKINEDGPTSRADWNQRIFNYAVQKIPSRKILMGMDTSVNDYNLTSHKDSIKLKPAELEGRLQENANSSSIKRFYDNTTQSPSIEYIDKSGNKHHIWYENEKSYANRMQFVHKYELGGIFYYKFLNDSDALNKLIDQGLR